MFLCSGAGAVYRAARLLPRGMWSPGGGVPGGQGLPGDISRLRAQKFVMGKV